MTYITFSIICVALLWGVLIILSKVLKGKNNEDTKILKQFVEGIFKAGLYLVVLILAIFNFKMIGEKGSISEYYLNGFIIMVTATEVFFNGRAARDAKNNLKNKTFLINTK